MQFDVFAQACTFYILLWYLNGLRRNIRSVYLKSNGRSIESSLSRSSLSKDLYQSRSIFRKQMMTDKHRGRAYEINPASISKRLIHTWGLKLVCPVPSSHQQYSGSQRLFKALLFCETDNHVWRGIAWTIERQSTLFCGNMYIEHQTGIVEPNSPTIVRTFPEPVHYRILLGTKQIGMKKFIRKTVASIAKVPSTVI